MSTKKILLLLILLSYLSGNFTLSRLNISLDLEVKFLFIFLFIAYIFVVKVPVRINKKNICTRGTSQFLATIILFFFILLISVFYSADKLLSFNAFLDVSFILILILSLLFVIPYFDKQEYFMFLSGFLIIFGLVFTIPIVIDVLGGAARSYLDFGGPNVTTRFIFFAFCSSIYRGVITKNRGYFLLSLLFTAGIVFVGSRGGLVGAVIALISIWSIKFLFVQWKIKRNPTISFKKIMILGLLLGGFIILFDSLYRVFMDRFINTTFSSRGIYTSGRDVLYNTSIQMIEERPILGHGIQGFAIRTGEQYPHNMLLEMMNDIGIFGALFFFIFLFFTIYLIFSYSKSKEYIFASIPIYMIFVQMFSGGLYDFRFYFLWALSLLIFKKKEKSISLKPLIKFKEFKLE